jgi:hypothetical protein
MEKPDTTQGNPPNETDIYKTLFAFMDDVLFRFRPSTNKPEENKITQDLEISLNEQTRIDDTFFAFQNQYEEGIYATDIGVYLRNNRQIFCWIEAKRLPTQNKKKDRDEREYVIVSQEKINGKKKFKGSGSGGGIQRFKEGRHAPNLPYSIMIGYIQDNTVDYWTVKINGWITELVNTDSFWNSEDCLSEYASDKCSRFLSVHKRTDGSKITLHHYWITLKTHIR